MHTFISSDIIYHAQCGNTLLETSSSTHCNCGIYYCTNDPNGNTPYARSNTNYSIFRRTR